jgi:Methyltransferase domain
MTGIRNDTPPHSPYRQLRRDLGRLATAIAPDLVARLLGRPRPARMPRLGPFRLPPSALARQVKYMADTGAGTQACLALGALPVPVHFYSPIPDITDLDARGVLLRRSAMGGVDMNVPAQLGLLAELGSAFGHECRWPHDPVEDAAAYVTSASGFSYGCAATLHMVLRQNQPRRVVEIGSGWSSRVIAAALSRNAAEDAPKADYTIIDPFPGEAIRRLPGVTSVIAERVETLSADLFDELQSGDVLFIDSGHTVRIGGDVNFLILDILPRLKPGVLVHFHDIALPYEYSRTYAVNPEFRVFWTEAYLLQAFLAFNSEYEVLLSMNLLMLDHVEKVRAALPAYDPQCHREISHSFWIRRCTPAAKA